MLQAWMGGDVSNVVRRLLVLSALVAGSASASTIADTSCNVGPAAVAAWASSNEEASPAHVRAARSELQHAQNIIGRVDFEVDPAGDDYLAALQQILDWAERADLSRHALALAQGLGSARAAFMEQTQSFRHWHEAQALESERDLVPVPSRFIEDLEIEDLPLPDFGARDVVGELLA